MPIEPDLKRVEEKIDSIYASVEKTRRYFFWTMIITIVVVVLPIIGLAFALPSFIQNYTSTLQGF